MSGSGTKCECRVVLITAAMSTGLKAAARFDDLGSRMTRLRDDASYCGEQTEMRNT
jgi:hypothetical protein